MKKKKLVLLGSTGKLGVLTLELWSQHFAQELELYALIGHTQKKKLFEQSAQFSAKMIGLTQQQSDESWQRHPSHPLPSNVKLLAGIESINNWLATLDERHLLVVLNSGIDLLPGILAALTNNVDTLISNKELIVCGGELLRKTLQSSRAKLLPLDSEHFAIWQCLPESAQANIGRFTLAELNIEKIYLTGSGGSFWNCSFEQLQLVTPSMACSHPIWPMGQKNSVDSATFMNKALECIEAHFLFGADPEQIEVVRHPQAKIHGAICHKDGTMLLQYAPSSMEIPIVSSLNFALHQHSSAQALALSQAFEPTCFFSNWFNLSFELLQTHKIPALRFAFQALIEGDGACLKFDAINSVLVSAFLKGSLSFSSILPMFEKIYVKHSIANSLEAVQRVQRHQMLKNFLNKEGSMGSSDLKSLKKIEIGCYI